MLSGKTRTGFARGCGAHAPGAVGLAWSGGTGVGRRGRRAAWIGHRLSPSPRADRAVGRPGARVGSPKGPPIRRRPGPGLRPPRPNSPARAARAPPLCESTRSLTSPAGSPRACEPRRGGLPARSNLRPPAACVGAREARTAGLAPRVTRPCRPA